MSQPSQSASQPKYIWFNGTLVPWQDAQVHVMSHALHYGSSVFEGVRAYDTPKGTCIFRLQEHNFNRIRIRGSIFVNRIRILLRYLCLNNF